MFFVLLLESTDPSMEPCCKGIQAIATMKAFLIAHSRQVDPSLPDGNCLFHSLYVKKLKKLLVTQQNMQTSKNFSLANFISQNSRKRLDRWQLFPEGTPCQGS